VLDDVSPLRQANASIAAEDAHLFTSRPAARTRMGHTRRRRYAIGENPPDGAALYYYLKEEPKDPVSWSYSTPRAKSSAHSPAKRRKKKVAPTSGKEMKPRSTSPRRPD